MHINAVIGYQSFTSQSMASAVAITNTIFKDGQGNAANLALFSVGGTAGAIRFRDDGGTPAAGTGHRLVNGALPFLYQGNLQNVKIILEAGNPDFSVTTYSSAD